jgi:hypothetical protein
MKRASSVILVAALLPLPPAALAGPASRSRAERCQMLEAILGLPHYGARLAFENLECVQPAKRRGRLLLRASLHQARDDRAGTSSARPLLGPGERCADRFEGDDPRRQGTALAPHWVVYLKVTESRAGLAFAVSLETFPPRTDGDGAVSPGTSCGASGEGFLVRDGQRWVVRD